MKVSVKKTPEIKKSSTKLPRPYKSCIILVSHAPQQQESRSHTFSQNCLEWLLQSLWSYRTRKQASPWSAPRAEWQGGCRLQNHLALWQFRPGDELEAVMLPLTGMPAVPRRRQKHGVGRRLPYVPRHRWGQWPLHRERAPRCDKLRRSSGTRLFEANDLFTYCGSSDERATHQMYRDVHSHSPSLLVKIALAT